MGYTPVRTAWLAMIAAASIETGAFGGAGALETRLDERREASDEAIARRRTLQGSKQFRTAYVRANFL